MVSFSVAMAVVNFVITSVYYTGFRGDGGCPGCWRSGRASVCMLGPFSRDWHCTHCLLTAGIFLKIRF